jgi:hypothetical protein
MNWNNRYAQEYERHSPADSISGTPLHKFYPLAEQKVRSSNEGKIPADMKSALTKIKKVHEQPDKLITVYRSAEQGSDPKTRLKKGDWVTTDQYQALSYRSNRQGPIITQRVPARHLYHVYTPENITDKYIHGPIQDFGYDPS